MALQVEASNVEAPRRYDITNHYTDSSIGVRIHQWLSSIEGMYIAHPRGIYRCFVSDLYWKFPRFSDRQNQSVVNAFHYVCSTKEHAKLNNIKEKWKDLPENMLLQEISRNYIHIQHQALNFLWFTKKWVVDLVAPTNFFLHPVLSWFCWRIKKMMIFLKKMTVFF